MITTYLTTGKIFFILLNAVKGSFYPIRQQIFFRKQEGDTTPRYDNVDNMIIDEDKLHIKAILAAEGEIVWDIIPVSLHSYLKYVIVPSLLIFPDFESEIS
jgi:hypothetical protein